LDWDFNRTYLIAGSVGLVGTVLNWVVALGDTVIVVCAANHFDFGWEMCFCGIEVFVDRIVLWKCRSEMFVNRMKVDGLMFYL
jgi:hypothetical protein